MKTFSKEYAEQLKELHEKKQSFGSKATELKRVEKLIDEYIIQSVLDYGCGKGALYRELKSKYPNSFIQGYDPGQEEFKTLPRPSDLVTSTDVMEHIEPEFLDNVLQHIFDLSIKVTYLEIACFPSKRILPDGRNAHLIVEKPEWWKQQILKHWTEEQLKDFKIVDKGVRIIQDQEVNIIYAKTILVK